MAVLHASAFADASTRRPGVHDDARFQGTTVRRASLMPWNQSGGGRRNGGAPHQRPDLEELLKRGQDKFKQAMPGGSGLPGSVLFAAVVMSGGGRRLLTPSPFASIPTSSAS